MQYIFVIFIIFYELFRTIFCPFALYLPQKAPDFPFFTISGGEQMFCNCRTKVLFKCRKMNFSICLFYIGKRKKGRLPPAAGLRAHRYFRHLHHSRKCGGTLCLPCAKGGGTAYAVTEGLSHYYLQTTPQTPAAPAPHTGEPPLRQD